MSISFNNRSLMILFVCGYIIYLCSQIIMKIRRKKELSFANIAKQIFVVLYIWFVLSVTLLPIIIPPEGIKAYNINLNILQMFEYPEWQSAVRNIAGNVVMFMPLAFCTYFISGKTVSFGRIIMISLIGSLSIEILQFIENISGLADLSYRTSDINDVILNVAGGIIGWLLYVIYQKYLQLQD